MAISIHQSEFRLNLQDLGDKLQSFFDDFPICVQCAIRDERLIVLGQHPAWASIDPTHILKVLERRIQSFQLDFTKQVRLYLRVSGTSQPYAHRWFMIQPPPPPPLRMLGSLPQGEPGVAAALPESDTEDEHWFVEDDELDALVHQLTASHPLDQPMAIAAPAPIDESLPYAVSGDAQLISRFDQNSASGDITLNDSYLTEHSGDGQNAAATAPGKSETALALPNLRTLTHSSVQEGLSQARSLHHHAQDKVRLLTRGVLHQLSTKHTAVLTDHPLSKIDGRMAIAAGAAVLGIAGAAYSVTRPCAVGDCTPLHTAQDLSTASSQILRKANRWQDLEAAREKLTQALDLLEPIPLWSHHAHRADQLISTYQDHIIAIETMLDMEELAYTASQAEQDEIHSIADLETVQSLWQDVIQTFEAVPATSDLYPFALKHIGTYRDRLAAIDRRIQAEQAAMQALDNAKQAAQLAQTRQGVARTLENWQFARVTWIVAVERLTSVPRNTLAGAEAQRFLNDYQASLDGVNHRVQREQAAVRILEQAEQRAQIAQAAEYRFDWQQAVADWDRAIAHAQQVDTDTHYKLKAEELITHYTNSLTDAQEKLQTTERVQTELEQTCIGEIRICNLISVGQAIKVRLDDGYINAIEAARSSGNTQLQAVITDHQLILRRTLEQIARTYQLPIEVYDDGDTLLERHAPD